MFRRLILASALPMSLAVAQTPGMPGGMVPSPSIQFTTQHEVKVAPDRATIRIAVQTRAATAVEAAAKNATKQTAVLDALRKLGIPNERLSTSDYSVQPNYRYEPNQDPILSGYNVTNTVIAELHDLTQVGKVIDAAIANGSNMISSLDFYASNTDTARQTALTMAIAKAKIQAAVAARAAGGSIGGLLELSISDETGSPNPPPRPMYKAMAMDAAAPTPINPGQQSVIVSVYTRWQFVATP